MNQEGIFKKVGQILNELQDQYDFLARNPGQLNDLELELFLANANFLSDHVQIVKKFNSNKPLEISEHTEDESVETVATEQVEMKVAEPVEEELKMEKGKTLEELEAEYASVYEPKVEESAEEVVEKEAEEESRPETLKFEFLMDHKEENDQFEFEQQSIETIFDRPLSKEEEEIIAQKQRLRDQPHQPVEKIEETVSPESVIVPEPVVVAQHIAPTPVERVQEEPVEKAVEPVPVTPVAVTPAFVPPVFEQVAEPVKESEQMQVRPTLNDLLASKSNGATSLNEENNNKAKITDLKQAINLNEKLLYIKDLFNGYNLAYAEAIELINKMPDFTSADNFLRNNYAVKNNWAAKQTTVDKFYDLLNQRFDVK